MYKLRKVVSALASTLMIGSTVALAGAATFPAPFVQNGQAQYAIVYGSAAGTGTDMIAANDISSTLTNALSSTGSTTSSGSVTPVGGDFVQLSKSNNKFNLGESANSFHTSLGDDELSNVLASGVFENSEGDEFEYDQKITLGNNFLEHFQDNDFNDEEPIIGISMDSGAHVLNYTLEFTPTAAAGGAGLAYLENEVISMLGRTYYILDAVNTTATNHKIDFLDAANTVMLAEGETKSMDVGGQKYDVSISFISDTEVVLNINGADTKSLTEGRTAKLNGDVYVGIKDIRAQNYAGGLKQVEFSLGSGKITMQNGQEVEINGEKVSKNADSKITAYLDFDGNDMESLTLEWTTRDDQFIAPGTDLVMPGLGVVKLFMSGFVVGAEELTKVTPDGDESFKLSTEVTDGPVSFNFLYSNGVNFTMIGKSATKRLVTNSTSSATTQREIAFDMDTDEWFVATWISGDDSESYVLQVTDIDDSTPTKNTTTIESVATGSTTGLTLNLGDSKDMGSLTFTLASASELTKRAVLNITAGSGAVYVDRLVTKEGLLIQLPYEDLTSSIVHGAMDLNESTWIMNFTEETRDGDIGAGKSFAANLRVIGGETTVASYVSELAFSTGSDYETSDGSKDYVGYVNSTLATKALLKTGGDQDELELTYHGSEAYGEVFISEAAVSADGEPQLGSVVVADTQVSTVEDENLIVVGGSCVNTVAAQLLGVAYPVCGADFTAKTNVAAGQYLIQSFESPYNSAKIATLVAGYNAGDTTNAATYFRTQSGVVTDKGTKYIGSTSSSADIVTQLN